MLLPIYASTAWVSASRPVVEVIFGGRPTVSSGSSTAIFGRRQGSLIAYFSCVCVLETTAASVVSEPVPAVVGTAKNGGSLCITFITPRICGMVLFGRTTLAAAALAQSIGLPPPNAIIASQPLATNISRASSMFSIEGLG